MYNLNTTRGIAFPLTLTNGKHTLVEGSDLIHASIKTIISWPYLTRWYSDTFGSRIDEVLEQQNDSVLITLVRAFVIDAIGYWEKRIELKAVEIIKPNPEKLVINLNYRIKDLNADMVLEYGFYIN